MLTITVQPRNNISLHRDQSKLFQYVVYTYRMFFVLLGLDFGFIAFKTQNIKIFSYLWALFPCALFTVLNAISSINTNVLSGFIAIHSFVWFLNIFGIVISLKYFRKEYSFANLIQDLRTIDIGLNVNYVTYNIELKLFLVLMACTLYRFITPVFLIHFTDLSSAVAAFAGAVCCITTDIVYITKGFMFYSIHCRLEKLGEYLKTKNDGFISVQYMYKSIVDIAERCKKTYAPVMILTLLLYVPKSMAIMYLAAKNLQAYGKQVLTMYGFYIKLILAFEQFTIIILPALCAGLLATEANKIKAILHDLLLLPQGQREALVIRRFIRYVEIRGCHFRVCKVLPLDADLIGMVLGFCATYLIVIIQFTNPSSSATHGV